MPVWVEVPHDVVGEDDDAVLVRNPRKRTIRPRRGNGRLRMREGQQFAWQSLPVQVTPVLPGTVPVLQWLAQERTHTGPTHQP